MVSLLALYFGLFAIAHGASPGQVDDLIEKILQISPAERAAAQRYAAPRKTKPQTAKKDRSSKSAKPQGREKTSVPDLGIPDSQVMDAAAKFPKDFRGKFIYGRVVFKGVSIEYAGETPIMFEAKNGRGFTLYTKDAALIEFFSSLPWKTEFDIPRECPLRVVDKGWFIYVVRMPYDTSNKTYFLWEP